MPRRFNPHAENLVHIRLRPVWAYIDGIREFAAFFCETTFEKGILADRVRLVTHELLENAAKYSESECNDIELSIQKIDNTFHIAVSNYPSKEGAERLAAELELLQSMGIQDGYQAALARAAVGLQGESKLGLARIRYEGQVELSILRHEGGQIRVIAKGDL